MTKEITVQELIEELTNHSQFVHSSNTENVTALSSDRFSTSLDDTQPGFTALLYKGVTFDPHSKINELLEKSPGLIICEDDSRLKNSPVPFIAVRSGRAAWAICYSLFHDTPGDKIKMVGITGTNGKTSVVWFLNQLFENENYNCAALGTLGFYNKKTHTEINHTTPDPPALYSLIDQAVKGGCEYFVMEASSHAIAQKKLIPLKFSACGFTSFSQDHLDFHKTMDEYLHCKQELFESYAKSDAVKFAHKDLKDNAPQSAKGYGLGLNISKLNESIYQTQMTVTLRNTPLTFSTNIVGEYFCDNLSLAILMYFELTGKIPKKESIENITSVPGRLENISHAFAEKDVPQVFVDYAHTPDAVNKTCATLKKLSQGPLTVVFGCGGDRDKSKRPLMLEAASEHATTVWVTSDNPRGEDPNNIIKDIIKDSPNQKHLHVEPNRKIAIENAISQASQDSVILIAGKGHESYQLIAGVKHPFSDQEEAKNALKKKLSDDKA